MILTVIHGLRRAERNFVQPPTVAQIKQDQSLRLELGYGDNCKVISNGVELPDYTAIVQPAIEIETAVNSKQS